MKENNYCGCERLFIIMQSRRQIRDKEKNAALLIENYYKNYVQVSLAKIEVVYEAYCGGL